MTIKLTKGIYDNIFVLIPSITLDCDTTYNKNKVVIAIFEFLKWYFEIKVYKEDK